jgi:hypothetical protein
MYARLQSRCNANADALTVAGLSVTGGRSTGSGIVGGSCCVAVGYSDWIKSSARSTPCWGRVMEQFVHAVGTATFDVGQGGEAPAFEARTDRAVRRGVCSLRGFPLS